MLSNWWKTSKMSLPGNGIFVVQGEMAMLVTAMRRSTRWGSHSFPNEEYDVLMRTFQDLKTILNQVEDLRLLDPATYLSPFLEVIRSKETTGPVTSLALSAIHKFLSYGLIDPTHPSVPATVEDIADAVTHARFVGTDHSSDGVVLMKILQVLRTLMLSPEGAMLTDESVCEIMLSCFRICFETRLTELLRRNAEQCLRDMTQLIFMRLPQFGADDPPGSFPAGALSLKKRDKPAKKKLATLTGSNSADRKSPTEALPSPPGEAESDTDVHKLDPHRHAQDKNLINEAEITIEPVETVKTPSKKHGRHSSMDLASNNSITQLLEKCVEPTDGADPDAAEPVPEKPEDSTSPIPDAEDTEKKRQEEGPEKEAEKPEEPQDYVNHRGIRFTQEEAVNLQPYGLVCVRELFRFLISLCNPLDQQNTSAMVHLGLGLVQTALEVAADQIATYPSLLYLVKDPLCKNLLSLLSTERISIFALDLQVSFLLFEALRFHLKFQMEAFFKKLIEIISSDTTKAIYELKEIHHLALESLAQMFRIPGLCAELYLNYDCDVYCTNVFEDLTKLLSKNVVSSPAYNIHTLSLEALMTIIEAIEMGVNQNENQREMKDETEVMSVMETKYGRGGHVSLELGGMDDASVASDHVTHDISQYVGDKVGRHKPWTDLPTEAELDNIRNLKKWVQQGTELFNQKPEKGIEFLQEHGVLATPLDPHEVAMFLRENPDLDKKMIGEYICKRSSRGEDDDGHSVLSAFASSFELAGLRIDQALRLYLETFRLPGEAPLIFLVMERFADCWHTANGEPFANTDAAFRLAYAIIILNVDQHNTNAKKINVPMSMEAFVRNLRGCNGAGDFDQAMLEAIYQAIKDEEMVMPAEHVGPVREAYLWRVLQRRGAAPAGRYRAVATADRHRRRSLHARLFAHACPPTVTALSAAFERSAPPTAEEVESNNLRDSPALVSLSGLERCAALIARLPPGDLNLDTLLLTLCKFTGLLAPQNLSYIAIGVSLGQSTKSQLALKRACAVCARHADCARAAWRHLAECARSLYAARLLPKCLVEAEDYLAPSGTVSLVRDPARGSEAGLLSSIYSYIALGESGARAPTPHEKALIDAAAACVADCNLPGLLITETRFLRTESLQELVRALIAVGTPPDSDSIQLNPQLEDITIFFLELLGQTLIQNRDRLLTVWDEAGPHFQRCVLWSATRCSYCLSRSLTALLRASSRLMRCAACAPRVLDNLTVLFQLPYKLFLQQSDVISCGLHDLVKTSAQNVHSTAEWRAVFALLCAAGAGAWPRDAAPHTRTAASSRSEGSDDESDRRPTSVSSESELSHSPHTQGWILVKNEANTAPTPDDLASSVTLRPHRASALARCCEALALVVRDVAHVTPYNCRDAVRAVRLFAAAAAKRPKSRESRKHRPHSRRRDDDSSDEEVDASDQHHLVSIQLLDLMHTLHSRTAQIFQWWRDEGQGGEDYDLWEVAWKPLLQGIAQFCTDRRKQVANSAIAYLQRALLVPGLSAMGGSGWEACFQSVLFPLLEKLPRRAETAARANTIMCKVFLQHLSALSPRPTFGALWVRVVDAQQKLVAASPDDPLTEAALESLKNMILVMDSVKIFSNGDGYNDLWYITWEKISEFHPTLKDELFPQAQDGGRPSNLPSHMHPTIPPSLPTLIPVPTSTPTLLPPTSQPLGPTLTPPQGRDNTGMNQSSLGQNQSGLGQNQSSLGQNQSSLGQNQSSFGQNQSGLGQNQSSFGQNQSGLGQNQSGLVQNLSSLGRIQPNIVNLPQSPNNLIYQSNPVQNSSISVIPQQNTHPSYSNQNPILIPQRSNQGNSPVNISQTPPLVGNAPTLVAPTPISGMVPIRNPLYDQAGLTSSVLLQPLNEMISTPIGISLQSQVPMLYPQTETKAATETRTETEPEKPKLIEEPNIPISEPKTATLNIKDSIIDTNVDKSELFAEYLTNPYNEKQDISKEATLYDPQNKDQTDGVTNPLLTVLDKQKSLSEHTTPMHKSKTQFGSSDNITKQESSIFNFTSYFSSNEIGASEVFDTLMSSQEG